MYNKLYKISAPNNIYDKNRIITFYLNGNFYNNVSINEDYVKGYLLAKEEDGWRELVTKEDVKKMEDEYLELLSKLKILNSEIERTKEYILD